MSESTHPADTSKDGGQIDTTRATMQQALRILERDCQALLECHQDPATGAILETDQVAIAAFDEYTHTITALRAALAEQAQSVNLTDADIEAVMSPCHDSDRGRYLRREFLDSFKRVYTKLHPPAPVVPQPLTIERLRAALVASRVIPPEAVEDADNYDDGAMLGRIEALHRRIA